MALEHKLRILHISDLHEHGTNEKEAWRRTKVLGEEFGKNLDQFCASGAIDLIFFTGDLANWGKGTEYHPPVSSFLEYVLQRTSVPRSRLFVVPGNHDIDRDVSPRIWAQARAAIAATDPQQVSRWIAGNTLPVGFKQTWRDALLRREQAFWNWVATDLGRGELLPARSPHGYLGYRQTLSELRPFPIHIIGLDTAWLAGKQNDAGELLLTEDQIMRLSTDERGNRLGGLRLALLHHPISDLSDQTHSRRLLADNVDLVFRGHMHDPEAQMFEDPDRRLCVLAAGCLYDRTATTAYPNECQLLEVTTSETGAFRQAELHCRSWSERGFWNDDNSYYRNSANGRIAVFKSGPLLASTPTAILRIVARDDVVVRGMVANDPLGQLWGSPDGSMGTPIDLVIEGAFELCGELVNAVLRLGLHGGLNTLYVDDPTVWDRAGSSLITCIGVEGTSWKWSCAVSAHQWRILARTAAPAIPPSPEHTANLVTFADTLQKNMAAWVWDRLKRLMNDALLGDVAHTHLDVHESVRAQMRPLWKQWSATIEAHPGLIDHFLSAALTPATPLRSDTARARLGPNVVERGLLRGVLFALAVEVGILANTKPHAAPRPVNLVFSDSTAHLVALELVSNRMLHTVSLDLAHEPPFLLLANFRAPAERLADARQRIGTNTSGAIRIGSLDLFYPFTFTADPLFDIALRDGLAELRLHFRGLAERTSQAQLDRIGHTAAERV